QVSDLGKARRPAEMRGLECQELLDVARIGLNGLRGHPPLARQLPPPEPDGLHEVGRAVDERGVVIANASHAYLRRADGEGGVNSSGDPVTSSLKANGCVTQPSGAGSRRSRR